MLRMARMIPHAITADMVEKFKVPDSELRVFRALSELPDDYVCIWNVVWGRQETVYEVGEIDFIVLHPKFPLTVLEVKGGQLTCQHGRWQRWVKGEHQNMTSPVNQVFENRKALLNRLQNIGGFPKDGFIPTAAVVVLTNTSRESLLGLPESNKFVLTAESFSNFRENLERVMAIPEANLNPHSSGINKGRVDFLYKYFSRLPSMQVPLRSLMELDNAALERLSVDHYLTIDQLDDEQKVVINGGAGTGKTVLAVQKAVREAQDGRKTLLLCFNRLLAEDLKSRISAHPKTVSEFIHVCNFHSLCEDICSSDGQLPQRKAMNDTEYYNAVVETAESVVTGTTESKIKFDSIIVDEGQDFKGRWWDILEFVRNANPEGHFWIFKDDFQNVQQGDVSLREDFFSFRLLRNFRNSQSVFKLIRQSRLNRFVEDALAVGPAGAGCSVIPVLDTEDLKKKVGASLKRLTETEQIARENIVILTGATLDGPTARSALKDVNELAGIPLTRDKNAVQKKVLVETVRKYKGLENKYVILVEVDVNEPEKFDENEKLVYVGASRAVSALTIFARAETLQRLGFSSSEGTKNQE
jgi:hypothetical protein